jgi:Ca2+-binding RTX toxin-like protein
MRVRRLHHRQRDVNPESQRDSSQGDAQQMKHLIRLKASRTVWLVAVIAAAAGIVTGAGQASYPPKFKTPKLANGVLTVKGTKASEKIALRLQAGDPGALQVDVGDDGSAEFSFPRARITKVAVRAQAGNDVVRVDESNGAFTDTIPTTIDGGDGKDTIAGGKGIETLLGGAGNDSIDGNGGNDLAVLGAGNDTFVWDPGDGSDSVEGNQGTDTMLFNGANAAEQVDVSANGSRLRFFRNPGNVTMDTAGVERVDFNALGGADVVTVSDLARTAVRAVNVDLAGTLGGAAGDGQSDRVVVNATNGDDTITAAGDAASVNASGLAATTKILHPEAANDRLEINTLAGTDRVDSGGLAAGAIQLLVDGLLVR